MEEAGEDPLNLTLPLQVEAETDEHWVKAKQEMGYREPDDDVQDDDDDVRG